MGLNSTDGKILNEILYHGGRVEHSYRMTPCHTLVNVYIPSAAQTPGGIAELAAGRKDDINISLTDSFIFQPLAHETLVQINLSGQPFLNTPARRTLHQLPWISKKSHLLQCVSVTIQHFNAIAFGLSLTQVEKKTILQYFQVKKASFGTVYQLYYLRRRRKNLGRQ